MKNIVSRTLITAAAASMAFAPIAVQANTRAADNAPVYSETVAQPGISRAADGEEGRGQAGSVILLLLAAAAAIAGIIIVVDNDDDGQSPGT